MKPITIVNNKNKITGKKCQPVMSVTGINDQGLYGFGLYVGIKAAIRIMHFRGIVLQNNF